MAIPSYEFYTDAYFGVSILPEDWNRLAARADEQIAFWERVYTVSDPTRDGTGRDKAVCAIADQMYVYEMIASSELAVDENGNVGSTSVSIGSVSTSTKAPSTANLGLDMSEAGQMKTYLALAARYLDVYRGVG